MEFDTLPGTTVEQPITQPQYGVGVARIGRMLRIGPQLLQRAQVVGRLADDHRVAEDRVQVDQDTRPEQFVHELLADAVPPDAAQQRRAHRRGVVVDMQIRIHPPPLGQIVEHLPERAAFCGAVELVRAERPTQRQVHNVRSADLDRAGHPFAALDGEREVAGGGRWQRAERGRVGQRVRGRTRIFTSQLGFRLAAQRCDGARRHIRYRDLGGGQPINGAHSGFAQTSADRRWHAGHQQQIARGRKGGGTGPAAAAGEIARVAPLDRQQFAEFLVHDALHPAPACAAHRKELAQRFGGALRTEVQPDERCGQRARMVQCRSTGGELERGAHSIGRRGHDTVHGVTDSVFRAYQKVAGAMESTVEESRAVNDVCARAQGCDGVGVRGRQRRDLLGRASRVVRWPVDLHHRAGEAGTVVGEVALPNTIDSVFEFGRRCGGAGFGREGAQFGVEGAQHCELAVRCAHEIDGGADDTITENEQTRPSCVFAGHPLPRAPRYAPTATL